MKNKYDVIIVGAGPAGLSFAISLAKLNLQVLIVEKNSLKDISNPTNDGREIALTHLSKKLMLKQNTWQNIADNDISSIKSAKVFNGDFSYSLDFNANNKDIKTLGFLVANFVIRKAIYEEVTKLSTVDILYDTNVIDVFSNDEYAEIKTNDKIFTTNLIVAADSRFSQTRRKIGIPAKMNDFSRTAIVCRMKHQKPNKQTALECFFYGRTMAVLPMNNNISSIVITISTKKVNSVMNLTDEEFNQDVEKQLIEMKFA